MGTVTSDAGTKQQSTDNQNQAKDVNTASQQSQTQEPNIGGSQSNYGQSREDTIPIGEHVSYQLQDSDLGQPGCDKEDDKHQVYPALITKKGEGNTASLTVFAEGHIFYVKNAPKASNGELTPGTWIW